MHSHYQILLSTATALMYLLASIAKRTSTSDAKPTKQGEMEGSASVEIIVLSSMVLRRRDHRASLSGPDSLEHK
jgi:hypothetical protein